MALIENLDFGPGGPWNKANLFTYSRLPLFFVAVAVFYITTPGWSFITLTACGMTDFFDGKVARYYGVESQFGKELDPLVDKALIVLTSAWLLYELREPMLIWVLVGEAAIGLGALYYKNKGVSVATTLAGKWAMTYKMCLVGVYFAGLTWVSHHIDVSSLNNAGDIMVWASVLMVAIIMHEHWTEYRTLARTEP